LSYGRTVTFATERAYQRRERVANRRQPPPTGAARAPRGLADRRCARADWAAPRRGADHGRERRTVDARHQAAHPRDLPRVARPRREAQRRLGRLLLLVLPRRHRADDQERVRPPDLQATPRRGRGGARRARLRRRRRDRLARVRQPPRAARHLPPHAVRRGRDEPGALAHHVLLRRPRPSAIRRRARGTGWRAHPHRGGGRRRGGLVPEPARARRAHVVVVPAQRDPRDVREGGSDDASSRRASERRALLDVFRPLR